jgi:hypothetical protein
MEVSGQLHSHGPSIPEKGPLALHRRLKGPYCQTGPFKERTDLVEKFKLGEKDNVKSKYAYIQKEIWKGERVNLSLTTAWRHTRGLAV